MDSEQRVFVILIGMCLTAVVLLQMIDALVEVLK